MHEWDGVCFACLRRRVKEQKHFALCWRRRWGVVMGVEITASAGEGGRSGPTGEGGSEEFVWESLCRLSRGRHYLHLSVIARWPLTGGSGGLSTLISGPCLGMFHRPSAMTVRQTDPQQRAGDGPLSALNDSFLLSCQRSSCSRALLIVLKNVFLCLLPSFFQFKLHRRSKKLLSIILKRWRETYSRHRWSVIRKTAVCADRTSGRCLFTCTHIC